MQPDQQPDAGAAEPDADEYTARYQYARTFGYSHAAAERDAYAHCAAITEWRAFRYAYDAYTAAYDAALADYDARHAPAAEGDRHLDHGGADTGGA